jgi:lysyl-tRNA synthetase, class II
MAEEKNESRPGASAAAEATETTEVTAEEVNRLIVERQKKVRELREAGENPYRNDFVVTHTTADVRAAVAAAPAPTPTAAPEGEAAGKGGGVVPLLETRFVIAGRIVEHRSFGKAAFVKLADRSGRLQVYVRKDVVGEAAYAIFKKAEAWDILGARGYPFVTKTGELTLMAEEAVLLTKAVRPPPEKWKGLRDKEVRYRQRYVDLVANPEVAEVFRARSRIVRRMRAFLDERDFLEVETPILHAILGGAAARPFSTHHNALDMPLYLRIAPELFLKRLVVGGFDRVYEIGRNFRNEGLSREHNPEFTMLEFYMAYATYQTLLAMTEELIVSLADEVCGTRKIQNQGQAIDLEPPWPRVPVREAVLKGCAEAGFAPRLTEAIIDDEGALERWCRDAGLLARGDALAEMLKHASGHGKRIGALFDQVGEAHLQKDRPVFVVDYPAATSPLSRRKDKDPALVDRFELFVAERELANAFSELNDPADQRDRFAQQLQERQRGDEEAMEYDEDYCRALEVGMPPTAGEGIGIDRLVMLLCDQPSIRDVILFPHMRPEGR